ncbi:MAG TPA: hypothetical protein VMC10_14455 [Stellaceae bacterium]|nr:hypothetical protein [Stellaceae bacterium]
MNALWPWLVVAGLGVYHGLNPAMGWLFAVALGLHRRSRAVVLQSLLPIALGHALSIAIVAALVVAAGVVIDAALVRRAAGIALLAWALYHQLYGTRHRVRVGMQTGMAGLALWSFLMASAHGAGLMLVPALIPLCLGNGPAMTLTASGSLEIALAAVGLHTAAMLAVTGTIAIVVYQWVGVDFLRRGWINLDLIWSAALVLTGLVLLVL